MNPSAPSDSAASATDSARYIDHPLTGLFPMMPDFRHSALADDIRLNGQRVPITLFESKILDGRSRYRACLIAGIEPLFQEYHGKEPLPFVLSANLHCRHLSESQRALVAARLANLSVGRPKKEPIGSFSKERAALALNVSPRSVQRARFVLRNALFTMAVEAGEMTVAAAEKKIKASVNSPASRPDSGKVMDGADTPIPAHLVPLWNRVEEVRKLRRIIGRAISLVRAAQADERDPLWSGADLPSIAELLQWTTRQLTSLIPFAVCLVCGGRMPERCHHCQGKGFFNLQTYDLFKAGQHEVSQ